jgi:hypothetical protein
VTRAFKAVSSLRMETRGIGRIITFLKGGLAHSSAVAAGAHQHYFVGATTSMVVNWLAMVFLDPDYPPDEVMLQWHTTDWLGRAYWGANLIGWGKDGTPQRHFMGSLPPTGEWVRLEVPAQAVGLTGSAVKVNGMAFTLFGGRAIWDYAGVCKTSIFQPTRLCVCGIRLRPLPSH